MKKTQLFIALSCVPLAGLLYLLDLAKISTNVGSVEVNIYPVAGVLLLALVLVWRAFKPRNAAH